LATDLEDLPGAQRQELPGPLRRPVDVEVRRRAHDGDMALAETAQPASRRP